MLALFLIPRYLSINFAPLCMGLSDAVPNPQLIGFIEQAQFENSCSQRGIIGTSVFDSTLCMAAMTVHGGGCNSEDHRLQKFQFKCEACHDCYNFWYIWHNFSHRLLDRKRKCL